MLSKPLLSTSRLHGWFALGVPVEISEEKKEFVPCCVGGVELCIGWVQADSRENVLEAARQAGYTSLQGHSFEVCI